MKSAARTPRVAVRPLRAAHAGLTARTRLSGGDVATLPRRSRARGAACEFASRTPQRVRGGVGVWVWAGTAAWEKVARVTHWKAAY